MSDSQRPQSRSRRAVLTTAFGAAGAALLAGCGAKPLREVIRNGARVPPEDVAPLNELLDAEHYGVRAYAAAIPLLGSAAAKDARWLLSQELAHVVELSELVMQAKAKPRRPAASYNLGNPQTSSEALTLLEHAERVQLKAYLETIPKLSGGRVRAAVATLSANDAQHLALLRSRAGQPPTTAFATG